MLIATILLLHGALLVVRRRDWGPLHPLGLFPLVYLVWFGFGMIDFVDLPEDLFFGIFAPLRANIVPYVVAGYAAYVLGVAGGLRLGPRSAAKDVTWREHRLLFGITVLFAIFLGSYLAMIARIGIPVLAPDVGAARLAVGDHGMLNAAMLVAAWTVVPAAAYLAADSRLSRNIRNVLVVMAVTTLLLVASLGGRGYVVEGVLTGAAAVGMARRRMRWMPLAIGGAVLFILVSVAGYLRDRTVAEESAFDLLISGGIPAGLLPLVYAYMYLRTTVATFAALVTLVPATHGYYLGALSLSPILSVLPGQQPASDMVFRELLGYEFVGGGVPATLLGTLYADGGLIAIVLGLLLFGMLSGYMYAVTRTARWRPGADLVYAWVWHLALFSLFANLFPYLTAIAVPVTMALLARYVVRRETEAAPALTAQPVA